MGQVLTTEDLQIVAQQVDIFYSACLKKFKDYFYTSKEYIQEDLQIEQQTLLSDSDQPQ
jgi:hypothetical protein